MQKQINIARVVFRSYDHRSLNQAAKILIDFFKSQNAETTGLIRLPVQRSLYSINRDVFIYKNSQEQFVYKIHKGLIEVKYDENTNIFSSDQKLPLPTSVNVEVNFVNKKK